MSRSEAYSHRIGLVNEAVLPIDTAKVRLTHDVVPKYRKHDDDEIFYCRLRVVLQLDGAELAAKRERETARISLLYIRRACATCGQLT